jgi:hypothetical protein
MKLSTSRSEIKSSTIDELVNLSRLPVTSQLPWQSFPTQQNQSAMIEVCKRWSGWLYSIVSRKKAVMSEIINKDLQPLQAR